MLNSLNELNSLCKISLDVDNEEEMKHKLQSLQACIAIFLEPLSFERPKTTDLFLRGSISSIQENVKRTRMGHRRKHDISEVGEGSAPRPPLKQPRHMFLLHSKQKMSIFRKLYICYKDIGTKRSKLYLLQKL